VYRLVSSRLPSEWMWHSHLGVLSMPLSLNYRTMFSSRYQQLGSVDRSMSWTHLSRLVQQLVSSHLPFGWMWHSHLGIVSMPLSLCHRTMFSYCCQQLGSTHQSLSWTRLFRLMFRQVSSRLPVEWMWHSHLGIVSMPLSLVNHTLLSKGFQQLGSTHQSLSWTRLSRLVCQLVSSHLPVVWMWHSHLETVSIRLSLGHRTMFSHCFQQPDSVDQSMSWTRLSWLVQRLVSSLLLFEWMWYSH